MSEYITKFKLSDIFNEKDKYIVPLYQRAYSWTDIEIEQLIDDIDGFEEDEYYLGSLIVNKKDNEYEVIDGQQRLTTLFLLFNVLESKNHNALSFQCRDKSNYTLEHLNVNEREESLIEENILKGKKIIEEKLNGINDWKNRFSSKMSKIIMYRIEVPPHTDLNRYFEIMNTRGEQLEQHDILKAKLMNFLATSKERSAFSMIWNACRDMAGYVQMHFAKAAREALFGSRWDWLKDNPMAELIKINEDNESEIVSIKDFLNKGNPDFHSEENEYVERNRFESIIEFPYFLEHVLKVFVKENGIVAEKINEKLIPDLLDDKKLIDIFQNVIDNGIKDGQSLEHHAFSIDFINCLIKSRFLFDKYIIKREYPLNDQEGVWSLKTLDISGKNSQKKAYFKNTVFHSENEWGSTYEPRNKQNAMIQSCLRVSYTSPKVMHWITGLLDILYKSKAETDLVNFADKSENIAKEAVKQDFLDEGNYKLGVYTPHIVLNYLDYLIWKKDQSKYSDFVFEFRNSVEHWYPQHPSDGTFPKWDDVDTFGNLCIIQRNVNSKFSNMAPEAKKSTYKDMISKGSLKLRIMAEKTNSSIEWKDKDCAVHEDNMISMLKAAIN